MKVPASRGIIGLHHPLDKYFAYGLRNSFTIAFDPITGRLWDAENGPEYGDEINLVQPGFNSGWNKDRAYGYPKRIHQAMSPIILQVYLGLATKVDTGSQSLSSYHRLQALPQ